MDIPTSLTAFLEALPNEKLQGLYENQWTCQGVFRSLPAIAKQYCLRLLDINTPIRKELIAGWLVSQPEHKKTIDKLKNLQLIETPSSELSGGQIGLNPLFRRQILASLCGQGVEHTAVSERVAKYLPTETELISFANERWEALLLYLIGENSESLKQHIDLHGKGFALDRLLESASLGVIQESGAFMTTPEGYVFLLLDQASQLWKLVSRYIVAAENEMSTDLGKLCSFLLELGFRPAKKPGDIATLDPIQSKVATHMEQLGVLKTFTIPEGGVYYVPTPLASCFCAVPSAVAAESRLSDTVAVETNFKVYGYSDSTSFSRILDLFCRRDWYIPGLYAGTLTRESTSEALDRGLSAELMIHFLRIHAHPRTRHRSSNVPENVMDQLRIWETDIRCVKTTDAVLFEDFSSADDFAETVRYAKNHLLHLWNDGESRLIVKLSGRPIW